MDELYGGVCECEFVEDECSDGDGVDCGVVFLDEWLSCWFVDVVFVVWVESVLDVDECGDEWEGDEGEVWVVE